MPKTTKLKKNFLVEKYRKQGIKIQASWDHQRVDAVQIVLKPEIWVDLFDKEGETLPMCCGNISRVRDLLIDCMRESRFMQVRDLQEAAILLKNHSCDGMNATLSFIIDLWEQVKDDAGIVWGLASRLDPNDTVDLLDVLKDSISTIVFDDFFATTDDDDQTFLRKVNLNVELARLIPVIRIIHARIEKLNPGPIEGFAVVDKNNEVAKLRNGLAVLPSQEFAHEIAEYSNRGEKELDEDRRSHFIVRKCRVSLENGIEFLDS